MATGSDRRSGRSGRRCRGHRARRLRPGRQARPERRPRQCAQLDEQFGEPVRRINRPGAGDQIGPRPPAVQSRSAPAPVRARVASASTAWYPSSASPKSRPRREQLRLALQESAHAGDQRADQFRGQLLGEVPGERLHRQVAGRAARRPAATARRSSAQFALTEISQPIGSVIAGRPRR